MLALITSESFLPHVGTHNLRELPASYGGTRNLRELPASYGGTHNLRELPASYGGTRNLRDISGTPVPPVARTIMPLSKATHMHTRTWMGTPPPHAAALC